jgi:hypothetical protein
MSFDFDKAQAEISGSYIPNAELPAHKCEQALPLTDLKPGPTRLVTNSRAVAFSVETAS